jgi:hypothetical protein
MRPYLGGVFLLSLTVPLRWLLVTIHAGRAVLGAHVGALAAAIALETVACVAHLGILGVAWASAIAAAMLLVSMLVAAGNRGLLEGAIAVRLLVESLLLVAAALAVDAALASASWWLRLGVPAALGTAVVVGFMRAPNTSG